MANELPLFTVVVPTYNRPGHLSTCLNALAAQRYLAERFQVIVVDDGGQLSAEAPVRALRDRLDVHLLKRPHRGPAAARNAGAARAEGQVLAFTDDDCIPGPDWLAAFAAQHLRDPAHALYGRTVSALSDNGFASASQVLMDFLFRHYNSPDGSALFFLSNNLAVPAEAFRAVGGFDTRFTRAACEDRDFAARWTKCGYGAVYVSEAVVRHANPLNLARFLRQHFTYGAEAVRYIAIHVDREERALDARSVSFFVDLLRFSYDRRPRASAAIMTALIALSQMATAAGYAWSKVRGSEAGETTRETASCSTAAAGADGTGGGPEPDREKQLPEG